MTSFDNAGFEPLSFTDIGVIALSILVFLCLFFAGRAVTGSKTLQAIQIFIGLLAVYVFFIIGSVFSAGFSVINALVFLILLSLIGIWRSRKIIWEESIFLFFSIAFVTPLLWLAVVLNNPQWDDYSHWLPSAQFLLNYGHLPTLQEAVINNAHPSYPYARALLHTWVNLGMGNFVMNVQGVFNVLFASSLLLWAKPILHLQHKENAQNSIIITLSAMGILSFLLIIWTLTLNTRQIISSYADPIFGISIVHLFLFLFISRLRENSIGNGKFDWILAALICVPLIIKDTGFYYSIIIFMGYWMVYEGPNFLKSENPLNAKLRIFITQLLHFVPMILIKIIWTFYINTHAIKKSFGIRGFEESKIDLIPQILHAAETQIIGRPYILLALLMILFIVLFAKQPKEQTSPSPLSIFPFALLTATGIILFQLLAYLVTFSAYEAARAASFSRYIAPAGLITWTSLIISLILTNWMLNYKKAMIAGSLFSLIFFSATILNAEKINLASNVNPQLKKIAQNLIQNFPEDEPLLIIDLGTNGIHATIIRFYANSHMPISYRASVHVKGPLNDEVLDDWFKNTEHFYIHSGSQQQISVIKQYLASRKSKFGE